MGFALKIISFSGLKFCIQLILLLFIKFNEYKVPLVDRNNKLLFLSIAKLLSYFDTVFEGKTQYNYEHDNVDLKYIKIPFSTIADSLVKVTKSDVKKYMKKI